MTTNCLCLYAFDGGTGADIWIPLKGAAVTNDDWHHVRVIIDYTAEGMAGEISVFVNGERMSDGRPGVTKTSWTVAHNNSSKRKITSVSFRGTGAVDNFVGADEAVSTESYLFTGATFLNGAAYMEEGLLTSDSASALPPGTDAGFSAKETTSGGVALSSVTIVTFDTNGGTNETSYAFTYDEEAQVLNLPADYPEGMFTYNERKGQLKIVVPTDNATAEVEGDEILVVKVYYGGGDEPIEAVEPGEGLANWDWGTDDPKAPVEVVPAAGTDPETFVIRFVGQAGVTYQLIAVDSLDDDWDTDAEAVGTAVTPAAIGIVELSAPMTEDAQFFKIKATK